MIPKDLFIKRASYGSGDYRTRVWALFWKVPSGVTQLIYSNKDYSIVKRYATFINPLNLIPRNGDLVDIGSGWVGNRWRMDWD
jgi:hypothetical protein